MTSLSAPSRLFRGVIPIIVTPFQDDESLDLDSLRKVVQFMAQVGVNGVTVLGVLGEADRVTEQERVQIIETAVAARAGRLPVIVGISHSGTHAASELCRMAESCRAQGLLIAPSKDTAGDDSRIFEYYRRLSESSRLPICVQDYPPSSGVSMSVPLLLRLIAEIPTVAAIKVEAVPSTPKIAALAHGMAHRKPALLGGLGALYSFFELQSGADGFMTGFAFPEILLAMLQARDAGDLDLAFEIYRRYLPLIVFEQQSGVAIRKQIFQRRGLITSSRVRHPGAIASEYAIEQLKALLERVFPHSDLTRPIAVR
jgi:4-hydroxy-tetrahydrodipicolinate synthase